MRSAYIIIGILSIIVISAIVYGFVVAGNPLDTRSRKFDDERIQDLQSLKYAIEGYYRDNGSLPENLSDISSSKYTYGGEITKDPETNEDYDYSTTGQTDYKLCATFSHESNKNQSVYSYYTEEFKHQQGHHCFDLNVPTSTQSNYNETSNTPATTQLSEEILDNKIESVSSDVGSVAGLSNFPYGFFSSNESEAGFVSSQSKKQATVTFKFKEPVMIKSITNTFAMISADYCADNSCYSWSVKGITAEDESEDIVELTKTNPGSTGPSSNIVSRVFIDSGAKFAEIQITVKSLEKNGRVFWRKVKFEYE